MHLHRHPAPPWDGYTVKQSFFLFSFILYVLIFLFLCLTVEQDITTVFLATFPIILSIVLFSFVASLHPRRRMMVLATIVTPIFASLFFVTLIISHISARVNSMDSGNVLVWQLLSSFILLILSWLFVEHSTKSKIPELKKVNSEDSSPTAHSNHQIASQPPIFYNQIVQQYAQAARAHAQRATQLQSELASAQTALSTANLSNAKEHQYRQQITALEQKLNIEKMASQDAIARNSEYEKHIKNLQAIVDRLKDKLEVSDKNFTTRLRGIEDKAKAINFVIGRVYSDKNGGSARIREGLNIDRALYNAFSEMSADISAENKKKLISVLEAISKKLASLELAENKIFKISPRAKLTRDVHGKDTVLEVLAKNDTDPVLDYFVEAKEICSNMLAYLRK